MYVNANFKDATVNNKNVTREEALLFDPPSYNIESFASSWHLQNPCVLLGEIGEKLFTKRSYHFLLNNKLHK